MRIELTIPGLPIAQPRQRHRIVPGAKPWVQNYTVKAAPVNVFKAAIAMAASQARKGPPITGPVRLDWLARFPRPQGKVWKTKPMPSYPHTSKPDRDNLDKAILDALKNVLLTDDCQVWAGTTRKTVCAGDESPGIDIIITFSETEAAHA